MNRFLTELLLFFPVFVVSITCHEFAHAWVATRFGDPTPRLAGRLTLNPLRHLDLMGTLLLFIVHFGWAKPVPVDPGNLARPRLQMPLIAAAGPLANLGLALFGVLLFAMIRPGEGSMAAAVLVTLVWLNVALMLFNLLPLPPLDGSNALRSLLPAGMLESYDRLAPFGVVLVFAIFMLPGVSGAFSRLVWGVLQALFGLAL